MDEGVLRRWVEGYVRAWNSNDPHDIEALFNEDARYFTEPYAKPWRGRDEIVRSWLEIRDEPGQTEFRYDVLTVGGDLGIIKGSTTYKDPPKEYSNLWEIRLDSEGRAKEFVEWWMKK
jgi:uncharacterized protein (TIGR02246 family)